MRRLAPPGPPIRLLILDGDHTLWQPLDEVCCSERMDTERTAGPEFTFRAAPHDPDLVTRDDGARFRLTPGAREALARCRAADVSLALASFNLPAPVHRLLAAFGLLPLFAQVAAAWTPNKRPLLEIILAAEAAGGPPLPPATVLYVDDDPQGRYRPLAAHLGLRFLQLGNPAEVQSLAHLMNAILTTEDTEDTEV